MEMNRFMARTENKRFFRLTMTALLEQGTAAIQAAAIAALGALLSVDDDETRGSFQARF